MSPRLPISVHTRLLLLVLGCELVLLGGFSIINYRYTRRQWIESVAASLDAQAHALAESVEYEHNQYELEFSREQKRRFETGEHPDIFAFLKADGTLIAASQSLADLPGWVGPTTRTIAREFSFRDRNYRGQLFPAEFDPDSESNPSLRQGIVFYAKDEGELDNRLAANRHFICLALALLFVISIAMIRWIVRKGLAPLDQLALRTSSITEHDLGARFETSHYPADLATLVVAFNGLLARLSAAFDRERQFSADAAHELRTPVATLKSGIQAAQLSARDPGEDTRVLEDLLAEVNRMEELCETLLEIGATGALDPCSQISTADLLRETQLVVDGLKPLADDRGAHIELIGVPKMALDKHATQTTEIIARRILFNLIANALNHGGDGVKIGISLESHAERLDVVVEDNGPGIAEAFRPFLFRRLFKADAARGGQSPGAGLGLALSQSLARRQGGDLRFEPRAGGGSRFIWSVVALNNPG